MMDLPGPGSQLPDSMTQGARWRHAAPSARGCDPRRIPLIRRTQRSPLQRARDREAAPRGEAQSEGQAQTKIRSP
jgi:hypothetical protein